MKAGVTGEIIGRFRSAGPFKVARRSANVAPVRRKPPRDIIRIDEVTDADRVIVLHRGKVLADTTPADLVAKAGTTTIEQAFLAMTGTGPKRA